MSTTDQAERRKRVNLLKKLIMVFVFAIVLVPILLCVILSTRLHNLERDMQDIRQMLEQIVIEQSQFTAESMDPEDEVKQAQIQDSMQEDLPTESLVGEIAGENDASEKADLGPNGQPSVEGVLESFDGDASAETISQEEKLRKVYLTFDDGPNSTTGQILDILAAYDVKATFFVVGKDDEESQALLRRIVEEGHTLGMHSYSHVYDDIYSSVEGFASDLGKLQGYLYDVTGVTSTIYRFPGGSSNKVSSIDMQVFIRWLEKQGIEYYDWNISSGDANPVRLTAEQVLENCTKDLSRYRNAIILLHDAPSKKTTVEALPTLIETILEMEDTVILPITEDTKPVQHITNKEETEDE